MKPIYFPESNCEFGPPADMDESQVMKIFAYRGDVQGGSVDGSQQVIVAWMPNSLEKAAIFQGAPIYISMMGGLAPHFLTTTFKEALSPA